VARGETALIIIDRESWLSQVLQIRGTSLSVVWKRVALATLVGIGVTVPHEIWGTFHSNLTPLPFSLVGFALSIFLGFRNNTGYDRFWEGRKLWGAMVNVSRSFTRQLLTMVGPRMIDATGDHQAAANEREELERIRHELVYVLIAYVHAFRHHLRDEDALAELDGLVPAELRARLRGEINRPVAILQWIGDRLRGLYDRGWIHPMHLPVLEASLTEITGIQGACERIKSTPIPASYTVLIHRIVALYCVGLPFGIIGSVGALTPVVVAIVAYAFYGLDAVGSEIENPFGYDPNDLPLTTLSRMIEVNLRQRLGEDHLPALLEPVDGILQ
jgi:ion channel-forming bestrophin family protein